MTLPPLWKITRELTRPMKQLLQSPLRGASYFFAQAYYDRCLAPRVRHTDGQVAATKKLAIYLIFPNTGLLASHFKALSYLNENGYAPIVVSNLPLEDAQRAQILQQATLLIERPNYGYDFGGYRDAVLTVLERYPDIDRLALLNDSSWFPLPNSKNWLAEAEALDLNFVGAASNYGHPRAKPQAYQSIQWYYSSNHKNFHYCSFALLMSGALLRDVEFQRFWKKFPLTNNKAVTVRRGEIGLSTWVKSHGFSHGTTMGLSTLDEQLARYDSSQLSEMIQNTVITENDHFLALKHQMIEADHSKQDKIGFILSAVSAQGISYTLPHFTHPAHGFAFLKKSPVWLNEDASDITLKFAAALAADGDDTILQEARAIRAKRTPYAWGGRQNHAG